MLEFVVLITLILFVVYLILTFLSYASLVLNLIILIASYFLISKDLKDKDNHKYYLLSLFLTALFFIFSNTGLINNLLIFTQKILLSPATVAVIVLYIFAYLTGFVYESYHNLKEKYKR